MSIPHKKRGFRKTVVDRQSYRWKFLQSGTIVVSANVKPRNQLIINIDCQNSWLQDPANMHLHHLHPCSSPITTKFVAIAIQESIELGWQPESTAAKFNVGYQTGVFILESRLA